MRWRWRFTSVLAGGAAALGAAVPCATANPVAKVAIIDGQSAPARALMAATRWNGSCSGVLIGPRRVLVAAHCVDEPPAETPADAIGTAIVIGNPNHAGLTQARVVMAAVIASQALPAWPHTPDLAILELDRPSQITPAALPASTAQAQRLESPGMPILLAGFGETAFPATDPHLSPVLFEARLLLADCASAAPNLPPDQALYLVCAVPAPHADGSPGPTACFGDSGAPGLTETAGHFVLIGVVSGSVAIDSCAPGSPVLFAGVATSLGWLRKQLHGSLPPADPAPPSCARQRAALAAAGRSVRRLGNSLGRDPSRPARARYARASARERNMYAMVFMNC